jgi:uncharacterized membrane protein YqhA
MLGKGNWIAIFGVAVLYISSIVLVLFGVIKLYYVFYDLFIQLKNPSKIDTIIFTVNFIIIIEIYLLAIIIYTFAVGIYKLFVGNINFLPWYQIDNLDEMKAELSKAIVIFLTVFLLQKIVEWKDMNDLLFGGIVIVLICAVLVFYIRLLKNNVHNGSDS